jgi:hypothetical protein
VFHSTVSGDWIAVGPPLGSVKITPKYLVLSIIYAPPGGPKGTNTINYQHSNTQGTSTSISHSFKQAYSVTIEGSGGFLGANAGGDLGFSYSRDVTNKDSLAIDISTTTSIRAQGPDTEDGINNDNDSIILAVNPAIDVKVGKEFLLLSMVSNSPPPIRLSVAWLKNPSEFKKDAPGVKGYLDALGITEDEYSAIWHHDALAIPNSIPDPGRYAPSSTFMYSPPTPCEGTPQASLVAFDRKTTSTSEQTVTDQYEVDLAHFDKIGADAGAAEFKGKLTESGKWTWTTQASKSNSGSQLDTISMGVGGPHCGWPGSPVIQAYFDKVYGTYAFREVQGAVALEGMLPTATDQIRPALGIASAMVTGATPSNKVIVKDASGRQTDVYTDAKGTGQFLGTSPFRQQ